VFSTIVSEVFRSFSDDDCLLGETPIKTTAFSDDRDLGGVIVSADEKSG